jgi:hypothetical protein
MILLYPFSLLEYFLLQGPLCFLHSWELKEVTALEAEYIISVISRLSYKWENKTPNTMIFLCHCVAALVLLRLWHKHNHQYLNLLIWGCSSIVLNTELISSIKALIYKSHNYVLFCFVVRTKLFLHFPRYHFYLLFLSFFVMQCIYAPKINFEQYLSTAGQWRFLATLSNVLNDF